MRLLYMLREIRRRNTGEIYMLAGSIRGPALTANYSTETYPPQKKLNWSTESAAMIRRDPRNGFDEPQGSSATGGGVMIMCSDWKTLCKSRNWQYSQYCKILHIFIQLMQSKLSEPEYSQSVLGLEIFPKVPTLEALRFEFKTFQSLGPEYSHPLENS